MNEHNDARARCRVAIVLLFAAGTMLYGGKGVTEDWPTYRHDIARSSVTTETLPADLVLQWVFTPLNPPEPAWTDPAKEKPRVRFDEVFHVVSAGDRAYFASSADGKVYCLDAATGAIRWAALTQGPIRVAPTLADGRVYAGSDDGYAYCLDAATGDEIWKVRAAFGQNKVLGAGKMISLWPVRTGVLVDNGVAYFGAGVFPSESTFLCAVRASDGAELWCNDSFGEEGYKLEFGGISPQGALLASTDTIFMPSGRAMPAAFSRESGKLLYYCSPGGKIGGTWVLLEDNRLVAGTDIKQTYDATTGRVTRDTAYAWFPGLHLVTQGDFSYMVRFGEVCALDRRAFEQASEWRNRLAAEHAAAERQRKDSETRLRNTTGDEAERLKAEIAFLDQTMADLKGQMSRIEDAVHRWRKPCQHEHALILAGDTLYLGGNGEVAAAAAATGIEKWKAPVDGMACGLAAANGRLFVSTSTGAIYCYGHGPGEGGAVTPWLAGSVAADDPDSKRIEQAAAQIVALTGVTRGYCLDYGCGRGRLAYELAKRTELTIIGIDPDPANVDAARQLLDSAGLYGTRVIIDQGALENLPYADYFANLVVSETMLLSETPVGTPSEAFRVLKPCGGIVCVNEPATRSMDMAAVGGLLASADCGEPQPSPDGAWMTITRGKLSGAGAWTHQYADAANTACSPDSRVRGPLGVLWFGRPGPERMVERHARAAAPLALDGRMFVQGEHVVMAYDSYNGLLLWQREIPGAVRVRVDSDMSNMAIGPDGLFIAVSGTCLRLDPKTGETLSTYTLPDLGDGKPHRWGYLACANGLLYGSVADPLTKDYGEGWWQFRTGKTDEKPTTEEIAEALKNDRPPNDRDFWSFEYSGDMWRQMSPWPAWGSVDSPKGAVTERIMASDALFAIDPATGQLAWMHRGEAIAHPAVAIDGDTVFLAQCDVSEEEKAAALEVREALSGQGVVEKSETHYEPQHADVRRVLGLDARTGAKRWEQVLDLTECGGDRMGLACRDNLVFFFGCFSNHDRKLFTDGVLKWRRVTAVSAEDGHVVWSRPLNYLRRPVVMRDDILIEPRACDLHTGTVKMRAHPLTGQESEWEFVRPGHCCSVTSASENMFFLRGFFLWYYDREKDQGMLPFGGIRPGCWINLVPADGVLLFPEASAGCTCSYPVRSTVVMSPKREQATWAMCVQNGSLTPVQHMAINFGAPGDWRADDGTLWFSYPHPPSTSWHTYGVSFKLDEQFVGEPAYFCENFRGKAMSNAKDPWIFASGACGMTRCSIPLLGEGDAARTYTVRLYFSENVNEKEGVRSFDVKLQGQSVLRDFDIFRAAGGANTAVVQEFSGIAVQKALDVELVPRSADAPANQLPIINGIEVIAESTRVAAL